MNLTTIDTLNNLTASNPILSQFMCSCTNDWAVGGLMLACIILFWILGFVTGGNTAKQQ